MCGKFTQMYSWQQVHAFSDLLGTVSAASNDATVTFTPMRAVPVVHLGADGARVATPMLWGFTDRVAGGRRKPRLMHARGETVHRLPTFADAFRRRRGITWISTFNEGKEIATAYADGTATGATWTQQWTLRRNDGKPAIIAVVFDEFDVGNGTEREFVQVTTEANAMIAAITDRMPLMLDDADLPVWLGEERSTEEQVRALIRTAQFDAAAWEMAVEDPSKKPPRPRKR